MPKNQWAKLLIELVNLNIEFYMYIDKTRSPQAGPYWCHCMVKCPPLLDRVKNCTQKGGGGRGTGGQWLNLWHGR